MLNKTTETATMALLYIVLKGGQKPVSPRRIADELSVSPSYLAKTFNSLRRHGILEAHRGAQGGVTLNRPAEEITILDIIESCQELTVFDPNPPPPYMASHCNFHQVLTDVGQTMESVLAKWTLADLAADPCPALNPSDSHSCRVSEMCPKHRLPSAEEGAG